MSKSAKQSSFAKNLKAKLSVFQAAPVLFVGSGISRRYLGLPNWEELLHELAEIAGKDFAYYKSSADGLHPRIASLMVEDMHNVMWTDIYNELRESSVGHLLRRDSALKIFAAERIKRLDRSSDADLLAELELLRQVDVDAIITTNYDTLLENLFPQYKTFVGQDELLLSDQHGIGEIYKIHGSISNPNTLVLTEEDYKDYNKRNAYLAAKLMTFFAEHPIVFIGYSLSDDDVISTIKSLVMCLRPEHIRVLQDRMFVVKWQANAQPSIEHTVISALNVQIPAISITVPNFTELFNVLGSLERKFPAHTLRKLKERVYELVLNNDPQGKLFVDDIEGGDPSTIEVVMGVGAIKNFGKQGYVGLSRLDLCLDVLNDDRQLDSKEVINQAVPQLLSLGGNFPFIKYLLRAGYINSDGDLNDDIELDPKILQRYKDSEKMARPSVSQERHAKQLADVVHDFTGLVEKYRPDEVLQAVGALDPKTIDTTDLRDFLIRNQPDYVQDNTPSSPWAKAVCLYDRLMYLDTPW